jgi:5-methyltetrahydrofolate--homocysteine methyltransferase
MLDTGKDNLKKSKVRILDDPPRPPFWGSKVIEDIPLDDIYRYINEAALIRGQWGIKRGKRSDEEYQKILNEQVYPELSAIKIKSASEKLLQPKIVYGYFPCQSERDDLIIYDLKDTGSLEPDPLGELLRFTFPRQKDDRYLCISDFFLPKESEKIDVVAFQMVTMGKTASDYSKQLLSTNDYKDYLFFHGLSVESAEALAELSHKRIREELGIAGKDAADIKRLFSQGYQGSRFSFGYPACPNLEDHVKLFKLLRPERIGVTMTDAFMLNPEQSTDAIIVHHPEARFFNVSDK